MSFLFRHGFTFSEFRDMTTEEAKEDFSKHKPIMEDLIRRIGEELKRTDLPQIEIDVLKEVQDGLYLILEGGHTKWQQLVG